MTRICKGAVTVKNRTFKTFDWLSDSVQMVLRGGNYTVHFKLHCKHVKILNMCAYSRYIQLVVVRRLSDIVYSFNKYNIIVIIFS